VHDAVMLVAESQCAIAAEVAVGFGLANLALDGKGCHEQNEVLYLIKNGCGHNRRYLIHAAKLHIIFQFLVLFPRKRCKK